jgi:hypothetical protein
MEQSKEDAKLEGRVEADEAEATVKRLGVFFKSGGSE